MDVNKYSAYFDDVRDECILECRLHTLEETANGMFSCNEVVDSLLKRQESSDEAFSIVLDMMHRYIADHDGGKIYIPGSGPGGLTRRIAKEFPRSNIWTVDSSKNMVKACGENSLGYDNIQVVCADIRDFDNGQKWDAIIAYGIMRYIPEQSRNHLVDLWHKGLKDDGLVIVGEGVAKDVVDGLNPGNYSETIPFEKDARLFRCSLFYTLNKQYHDDDVFRRYVDVSIYDMRCHGNVSYADVLSDMAGYTQSKVYMKIFKK